MGFPYVNPLVERRRRGFKCHTALCLRLDRHQTRTAVVTNFIANKGFFFLLVKELEVFGRFSFLFVARGDFLFKNWVRNYEIIEDGSDL